MIDCLVGLLYLFRLIPLGYGVIICWVFASNFEDNLQGKLTILTGPLNFMNCEMKEKVNSVVVKKKLRIP